MRTLLVLAGTHEARRVLRAVSSVQVAHQSAQTERPGAQIAVIASLAGATQNPDAYGCETRIGGFGGEAGLRRWMLENDVCGVLDATHPFAVQISANAAIACTALDVPHLRLHRTAWPVSSDWAEYETTADLAAALPSGARAFLTTGHGGLEHFVPRNDVTFLLRSIEPPGDLPPHITSLLARPPYALADETDLLSQHRITHLITKNAGGAPPAKLQAAKALGIEILSIAMPPPPPGHTVSTVEEALEWTTHLIAADG